MQTFVLPRHYQESEETATDGEDVAKLYLTPEPAGSSEAQRPTDRPQRTVHTQ